MDQDANKENVVKECHKKIHFYEQALKEILPKHFQKEYLSLADIEKRKEKAESVFSEAELKQMQKLDKLAEVQTQLEKFKNEMNVAEVE